MSTKSSIAETNIQKGWNFVFEKLYYPKTHMLYDFLYKDTIEESIPMFPTPEEIKRSLPNPCGWGTGMEDSTLNPCTMIEAVEQRYLATGDEEMKKYFDMLYEGLIINGTIAPEKGFIARCVAPSDGKSIYMDSSRDQYTNWVYAGHIILNSPLATAKQKDSVREILVDVAKKCERDVTAENDGYLLRLDGGRGHVSKMLTAATEVNAHEIQRLPMIYACAYEASNDRHWLDMYYKYRDKLLEETERRYTDEWHEKLINNQGNLFGVYQAQYSFRLLYDTETEEDYKKRYLELMKISAKSSEAFLDKAFECIGIYGEEQEFYTPWRETSATYHGTLDGYAYNVPTTRSGGKRGELVKKLRNTGEAIIVQTLCPGYEVNTLQREKFIKIVESTNFDSLKNYWVVTHCCAWWRLKNLEQISSK